MTSRGRVVRAVAAGGFTLIELIAVLSITGILVSIALPRFLTLEDGAAKQVFSGVVAELNARESLTWSDVKLSMQGWVDDDSVFLKMETGLSGFTWQPEVTSEGGKLRYKNRAGKLKRTASSATESGSWALTHLSE